MNYGKTIELFFVNGTAEGLVTAELSNWNAQAFRIPRDSVKQSSREDIMLPVDGVGVYFLVSKDENGARDKVYVGESENTRERLRQHLRDWDSDKEDLGDFYWHYAIAFVGSRLDKALIRYLENRIVETVKKYDRCECLTKNTFQAVKLKPSQIAAMEEFFDNIGTLLSALGSSILLPPPSAQSGVDLFHCKSKDAAGSGFLSSGGFTIVAQSRIKSKIASSFKEGQPTYYALRKKLIDSGIIKDNVFVKDYEFSSPSAASSVLLGRNSSGKKDWKLENGNTLGQETAVPDDISPEQQE